MLSSYLASIWHWWYCSSCEHLGRVEWAWLVWSNYGHQAIRPNAARGYWYQPANSVHRDRSNGYHKWWYVLIPNHHIYVWSKALISVYAFWDSSPLDPMMSELLRSLCDDIVGSWWDIASSCCSASTCVWLSQKTVPRMKECRVNANSFATAPNGHNRQITANVWTSPNPPSIPSGIQVEDMYLSLGHSILLIPCIDHLYLMLCYYGFVCFLICQIVPFWSGHCHWSAA